MNTCDNLETLPQFLCIQKFITVEISFIISKHRKNQKLAPGMLNVKTSQGKKKVDSKIQRL